MNRLSNSYTDWVAAKPKHLSRKPKALTPRQLVKEIERLRPIVLAKHPDMDPQTLLQILSSLLRPVGTGRRFFLRKLATPRGKLQRHVF